MNMFYEMPYFVTINNKRYSINTDFRVMLNFETKIQEMKNVGKEKRTKEILNILEQFYPTFFELKNEDITEACNKLAWFYRCGKEDYKEENAKGESNTEQIYSYEYDDDLIFGAFYQEYKIDLSIKKIHWWKFKALLDSLSENTQFVKVKGYRAYNGKDENLLKLKRFYELPVPESQKQIQQRLDEYLLGIQKG